ncbi:inositol monophosphatase family protein [Cellulomonas sp. URHE0023]|uniref:inositol monophosphatase family protein n=1 Tax=Cellulomonas sp. URHE0023 TaxID=1380354 RepID=UPI000690D97F|nr:inositol monophosphatase family protein [Cellulomonas sp. URHE0023]
MTTTIDQPRVPADLAGDVELALRATAIGLSVAQGDGDRGVLRLKGPNDLVTAIDLATEAAVVGALAEGSLLPVQGEEGSPGECAPDRWIVDPIDGTANFVTGLPLVACTLARLAGGNPVVGVTADVTTGETVWAARGAGAWLRMPGASNDVRVTTRSAAIDALTVTIGDLSWTSVAPWPLDVRSAVLREAATMFGKLRMVGTSATELSWVATGRTSASLAFGNAAWDVAAGVVLVREAGGVVRDARGEPWSLASDSILAAATPEIADAMVDAVRRGLADVQDPA